MFDKYFLVNDNRSAIRAAHITAASNEKLGRKLEAISQAEIKSKDRVDISLEEYTKMRERIQQLERENSQRDLLLTEMGIPREVIDAIIRDSIRVFHNDNCVDFKRRYHIEFDVDASPDLMKWRYEY